MNSGERGEKSDLGNFFFYLVIVDNRKKVVSCIEQCRGDGQVVQLSAVLIETFSPNHIPLNMPANLENSAVATGLEKVSFHSNP